MINSILLAAYRANGFSGLYPWQEECLQKIWEARPDRPNVIYSAPTSSGKSIVADTLLWTSLLECQTTPKAIAVYMLPYVSLVREKSAVLSAVGSYLNFIVHPYYFGAPKMDVDRVDVAVCTIEKAAQLLQHIFSTKRRVLLTLVIDEFHTFYTQGRGDLIENIIIKIKCFVARQNQTAPADPDENITIGGSEVCTVASLTKCQIVGMSATFPCREKLAKWLGAIDYASSYRPVRLQEYFVLEKKALFRCDGSTLIKCDSYRQECGYLEKPQCGDELTLESLCSDPILYRGHSVLLFSHSRKACSMLAKRMVPILSEAPSTSIGAGRAKLLLLLRNLALGAGAKDRVSLWSSIIPHAIGIHHSGLSNEEKTEIERGFRDGVLKLLVATSTLAAGVNLPASRVVFNKPWLGSTFLPLLDYKQMCGRAGRKGQGDYGEAFLLCQSQEELAKASSHLLKGEFHGQRMRSVDAWARLINDTCAISRDQGLLEQELLDMSKLHVDADTMLVDDPEKSCASVINALCKLGHKHSNLVIGKSPRATFVGLKKLCSQEWSDNTDMDFTFRSIVERMEPPTFLNEKRLTALSWLIGICCADSKSRWAFTQKMIDLVEFSSQLKGLYLKGFKHWLTPQFIELLKSRKSNICESGLYYGDICLTDLPGYRVIQYERIYYACILDFYLNCRGPLDALLERVEMSSGDLEGLAQSVLCNGMFVIHLAEVMRWQTIKDTLEMFIKRYSDERSVTRLHKLLPLLDRHIIKLLVKSGCYKSLDEIIQADPRLLGLVILNLSANHIVWGRLGWRVLSGAVCSTATDNPYELAKAIGQQIIAMACISQRGVRAWQKKRREQGGERPSSDSSDMFSMIIRQKFNYLLSIEAPQSGPFESNVLSITPLPSNSQHSLEHVKTLTSSPATGARTSLDSIGSPVHTLQLLTPTFSPEPNTATQILSPSNEQNSLDEFFTDLLLESENVEVDRKSLVVENDLEMSSDDSIMAGAPALGSKRELLENESALARKKIRSQ